MPNASLPAATASDPERLFQSLFADVPTIVRKACHSLGYKPSPEEFEGLVQRILLLLLDNDFRILRSFNNLSEPQTWLFTISRRYTLRRLNEKRRESSLQDLSPDAFVFLPDQEEKLLAAEHQQWLYSAASKLTAHEQKLFAYIISGEKAEEISRRMHIKKETVYRERSLLIKKLKGLVHLETSE